MKLSILTSVDEKGIIKRNRNEVLKAFESFKGKGLLLTFEKPRKKRSNPQNAYYWGVLIELTKEAVKNEWRDVWTKEMAHEFYKSKFLFYEKVNEDSGEVIRIPKSTTENSTTAQEEYHSEIRAFLLEWFNVEAPLPNEDITLNFNP